MSFQGIQTSYSGIRAAQAGISTTSHNVANATTAGYTRQRVDLVSNNPYASPVGLLGQGVDVADVSRQRDAFLDSRARAESGLLAGRQARADLLTRAEVHLGELDAGIDTTLSELFANLEELALQPDSSAVRNLVLDSMGRLATQVRTTSQGIEDLRELAVTGIRDTVSEVNGLIDAVATLNREIVGLSANGQANDLLDQRDLLVDQLASKMGANVIRLPSGSVRVSVNGLSLVDGAQVTKLSVDMAGNVVHPDGPVSAAGELSGYRQFLTVDLPGLEAQFDQFASDLADAFNTQNAAGFTMAGVAGGPLFDATNGARDLQVVATSPADLAAASSNPPGRYDGTNAGALAALRTTDLPSGLTLLEEYRTLATNLGVEAARATADVRSQQALADTANLARESQHGVSLDEEMAQLIAYQRALEANSRVLSAMDEALNVLINRTGAGR